MVNKQDEDESLQFFESSKSIYLYSRNYVSTQFSDRFVSTLTLLNGKMLHFYSNINEPELRHNTITISSNLFMIHFELGVKMIIILQEKTLKFSSI